MRTTNYREFCFDPAVLDAPKRPGISAYLRVKNGAQFVRLAVESHLPFYDEIVCVYNQCTDATPEILAELQRRHPDKIRVFHYLPKVHPAWTPEHRSTPTGSVHALTNFYNYALAQCRYQIAVKLDDDHLAIDGNLRPAVDLIRREAAEGLQKIYFFSGINLMLKDGAIVAGGTAKYPFSGQGDIKYHPVNSKLFYRQGRGTEKFNHYAIAKKNWQYLGILYFHLHWLKSTKAPYYSSLNSGDYYWCGLEEFAGAKNLHRLRALLTPRNRVRYFLHRNKTLRRWKYRITGRRVNMKVSRLLQLQEDLRGVDFDRDVRQSLQHLT